MRRSEAVSLLVRPVAFAASRKALGPSPTLLPSASRVLFNREQQLQEFGKAAESQSCSQCSKRFSPRFIGIECSDSHHNAD